MDLGLTSWIFLLKNMFWLKNVFLTCFLLTLNLSHFCRKISKLSDFVALLSQSGKYLCFWRKSRSFFLFCHKKCPIFGKKFVNLNLLPSIFRQASIKTHNFSRKNDIFSKYFPSLGFCTVKMTNFLGISSENRSTKGTFFKSAIKKFFGLKFVALLSRDARF